MGPDRELQVLIDGQVVGRLRDERDLWSFEYTSDWLQNPDAYALSPHLPLQQAALLDGASTRPVQWYFDNLLPEEGQRSLLAHDASLDAADAFGLLMHYGEESAGSLVLRPVEPTRRADIADGLRALPDELLATRIRQLPRIPLTHGASKRMSMAGVQHKLAVVWRDGLLWEPGGGTPSTQILKPDHPDSDYPHSAINEWFVMQLAGRVGLLVPAVRRHYTPLPTYLVDRFDRHVVDGDCKVDRDTPVGDSARQNRFGNAHAIRRNQRPKRPVAGWQA